MAIRLTDIAVRKTKEHLAGEAPERGMRVKVVGGGCSGLHYQLSIDSSRTEDIVFENDGVKIIVDADSLALIDNSIIDYNMGLHGAGFFLDNPNASRTCGCGQSFAPK
mgnify:CR=1 FL=1